MSIDQVLDELKAVQDLIEDEKEHLQNGLYVRLCDAMQKVYNHAHALKPGGNESGEDDEDDEESEESEEPRERTEDDMELNELSDLWEWQFDFGRPSATRPLEGLIEIIVGEGEEVKRVCAAVRVLNRAVRGSKPDDPADAERILEWKEELIEQRAIRVCAEILQKTDEREFHTPPYDDSDWFLYSILCSEILELFERLGTDDALFRTKLRRNGALEAAQEYAKENPSFSTADPVLNMLRKG